MKELKMQPNSPPGVKGRTRARALEKIETGYAKDASELTDLARSSIVFESLDDLYAALEDIVERREVVRMKDRFREPIEDGYRDILLNLRMSNGHIVELQLHIEQVLQAKIEGHKFYAQQRSIIAEAKKEGRDLTAAERAEIDRLVALQQDLYLKAFNSAL